MVAHVGTTNVTTAVAHITLQTGPKSASPLLLAYCISGFDHATKFTDSGQGDASLLPYSLHILEVFSLHVSRENNSAE